MEILLRAGGRGLRGHAQLVSIQKQFPGESQQDSTGFGEANARGRPLEQGHIEFRLEIADLPADRWLRDMQAFGGAGEIQLLGHGNKILEVA